ncbi:MAG: hypothetical protein EOO71_18455, partial [Myxococcaceae bacterium]
AARRYFGRPAERLSAGQAALLAGMARYARASSRSVTSPLPSTMPTP